MKRNIVLNYKHLLLSVVMVLTYACTKQDHFYKEFVEDRVQHYAGKADSLRVFPGDNRVMLKWYLFDPLVNAASIHWNNKRDSMFVEHATGTDSVELIISNLPETTHTFTIVTRDRNGNKSIPVTISGSSYGSNFRKTISNRMIRDLVYQNKKLSVKWQPELSETALFTEVVFSDTNGNRETVIMPVDENDCVLPGYKGGSSIEYRTAFVPEKNAIDTFYTEVAAITPEVYELLDWSKFREVRLPTDTYQEHATLKTSMPKMWNDDITSSSNLFLTVPNLSPIPQWFTFDLGVTASISHMRIWHRAGWYYNLGNLKRFEVYGSNEPNPDGSWESWTLLGTFQSTKPSGLPLGQTSQLDLDYILAGEMFVFEKNLPPFRYLRVKTLEVWGTVKYVCIQKMQIWANIPN
ncbi:MAG: DUF4998 domain-containing protein [Bacteroidota bacterium]|jgi:hypothetical protein|nr:DUF4998 domain-containing protein [Bacteroidota bacterium]HHU25546.1 hypothetical protein [Bacteroidales bacterium]